MASSYEIRQAYDIVFKDLIKNPKFIGELNHVSSTESINDGIKEVMSIIADKAGKTEEFERMWDKNNKNSKNARSLKDLQPGDIILRPNHKSTNRFTLFALVLNHSVDDIFTLQEYGNWGEQAFAKYDVSLEELQKNFRKCSEEELYELNLYHIDTALMIQHMEIENSQNEREDRY